MADDRSTTFRDDVLAAFAMDFETGKTGVLKKYLSQYPEYSMQLVDLSSELTREIDDSGILSTDELATVARAMERLTKQAATCPNLQDVSAKVFVEAAKVVGLPMQAAIALRERRVDTTTIPTSILISLAHALQAPVDVLKSYLTLPQKVSQLRASKSTVKPTTGDKVSFEKVLRDAGVDEPTLSKLLNTD
jgi:hypothetical protein